MPICHDYKNENMWGGRSPTPPNVYTFIPGAAGPRTPAIYSSNPQNSQNLFQCHGNGGLFDFYSKGCFEQLRFQQLHSNK